MITHHPHKRADYLGIVGSVLCLIHCLITPALAMGSSLLVEHEAHFANIPLDYFFILINGLAVYYATRSHGLKWLKAVLWSAYVLFSVSLVLEEQGSVFAWISYLGSGLLILGHGLNLYFCQWAAPRAPMKAS